MFVQLGIKHAINKINFVMVFTWATIYVATRYWTHCVL